METAIKKPVFDVAGWKRRVEADGFRVSASDCVVTITRHFAPGDLGAFTDCDSLGGLYLAELPRTAPGSTWGTDGGSVGGYSAVKSGCYRLNRSGISKRVVKALGR